MIVGQAPNQQIRSQSQDKSKLTFKARLDQKVTQLTQDDSNLPNNQMPNISKTNSNNYKN